MNISGPAAVAKPEMLFYAPGDLTVTILLRINRAKILLTKTDKSITQIAAECGYDDFTYFSRQFKKSTNMTPRDYRKEYADHGEAEE